MIINVGLVVHHKINLQSSADMAAYYGAMKQAELMNSIAHINYQMRQSWKLLAWRYRVLGTAGDQTYHPYMHLSGGFRPGMDAEYSESTAARGEFKTPPFCITYVPFNESVVPPDENTCKKSLSFTPNSERIRLFQPPAIVAGFISLAATTAALTQSLKSSALSRCSVVGPYNYIIVGSFMLSYQLDQYVRRVALTRLARSMSEDKNDFTDIEGNSVKSGAEETFKRNLTFANRESKDLSFNMYNSLSNCGNVPSDQELPPPWLSEIRVFPAITWIDLKNCETSTTSSIDFVQKNFDLVNTTNVDDINNQSSMPFSYWSGSMNPLVKDRIKYLATSLSIYNDRYRFILGYEKNPWCQAYVGVKASSKPKIPFAPKDLTLTAEAYAKPFGGKIGPWYFKKWTQSADNSDGTDPERTDVNLPLRVKDFSTLSSTPNLFASPLRVANFSKYIGDQYGLTSWRTLGVQAKAFFNLSASSPYRTAASASTATDTKILEPAGAPRLEDWDRIAIPVNSNNEKDILAWDGIKNHEPGMRSLEIQALAPDQFDIAYYSIEPNFYANYYKKMEAGIIKKLGLSTDFWRPDLGARIGDKNLEKFSVKDQIKTVKDISTSIIDFDTKLTYMVRNPVHVLTSWSNRSLFEFDKPHKDYFGRCMRPDIPSDNYSDPQTNSSFFKADESVPGECVTGGRTGYSVKIISKDSLYSSANFGGPDSGTGVIKNPPSGF